MAGGQQSVLFVCLGNICRSPIAEAIFRKQVTDRGIISKWKIDSAATSTYEIGNPADKRGQRCLMKHDISTNHIARQWMIDSAGVIDFNVGNSPDSRALSCLRQYGTETTHKARQVTKNDFLTFDYILCMDESNLRELKSMAEKVKNYKSQIKLLGSFDPQHHLIIEDPYYGNEAAFEEVYQQCLRCCTAFLEAST